MVSLADTAKQGAEDVSVAKTDALLSSASWEQGEGGFWTSLDHWTILQERLLNPFRQRENEALCVKKN